QSSSYILSVLFLLPNLFNSFFSTRPAPTQIYTLSLHDALPIYADAVEARPFPAPPPARLRGLSVRAVGERHLRRILAAARHLGRSEEHTSELQSRENLVCRLLLEKKKNKKSKKRRLSNGNINLQ